MGYQFACRRAVSGVSLLCLIMWLTGALVAADCNGNGRVDSEEIAAGDSEDCNDNSVPDECDNVALEIGVTRDIATIGDDAPRVLLSGDLDGAPDRARRAF